MAKYFLLVCAAGLVLGALVLRPAASLAQDATRTPRPTPTTKVCHICDDDAAPTSTPPTVMQPIARPGLDSFEWAVAIVVIFLAIIVGWAHARKQT